MARSIRIPISGGPFDGALIEAPRRTTPGLRLSLGDGTESAVYILRRVAGALVAEPEATAVLAAAADPRGAGRPVGRRSDSTLARPVRTPALIG